jgi:perosamine synthetase
MNGPIPPAAIDLHDSALVGDRLVQAIASVIGPATQFIGLHEPEFAGREWDYVKDCLDTGWVSSVGSYVDQIEVMLGEMTGTKAVACVNGTAALHMAYMLAGYHAGDEVLVPSLTFVATINPIHYIGAIPHFVDSCPSTLGVDPVALDAYLGDVAEMRGGECFNRTSGRRISGMVVTHVFGHAADMDRLLEVAARWGLALVEDAAEALGTLYKGKPVGGFGVTAALSFNGNKIVTTGGGGALISTCPDLAKRAKHLTTTAKQPHRWRFDHDAVAYNYRMPNINAALGCAQLERLGDALARKKLLHERYRDALHGISEVRYINAPEHSDSNNWLLGFMLDGATIDSRDTVLAALNDANYMSRPVWTLCHRLPMNADCPAAPLPVATRLEREIVNIPSSAQLITLP